MHEGMVIVNCSGKHVQLKEDKWTDDYASMMTGETTEFIKTNEIWSINWWLTSFFPTLFIIYQNLLKFT